MGVRGVCTPFGVTTPFWLAAGEAYLQEQSQTTSALSARHQSDHPGGRFPPQMASKPFPTLFPWVFSPSRGYLVL